MKLSIVVPVYCGGNTVPELVRALHGALHTHYALEMVLVDDSSPDDSAEVCRALAEQYEWVKVLCLSRNFSEHNAVMAGLNAASGDAVVIMDDDLQNPPGEVIKLVSELQRGYDVVYSRYETKRHSWFRNWGSALNDRVATVMLKKPRGLYLSSFKVLSRFTVAEVTRYDGPFPYIDGLILRVTRNIGVVTVEHHERKTGRSGYTLGKLISLWSNMFTSFSILPLRVASLLGLVVAGLGVAGAVALVVEWVMSAQIPVGWTFLAVSTLVLAGVQLFALGMLGEYLGRMFLALGKQPQFVVREYHNLQTPGLNTLSDTLPTLTGNSKPVPPSGRS